MGAIVLQARLAAAAGDARATQAPATPGCEDSGAPASAARLPADAAPGVVLAPARAASAADGKPQGRVHAATGPVTAPGALCRAYDDLTSEPAEVLGEAAHAPPAAATAPAQDPAACVGDHGTLGQDECRGLGDAPDSPFYDQMRAEALECAQRLLRGPLPGDARQQAGPRPSQPPRGARPDPACTERVRSAPGSASALEAAPPSPAARQPAGARGMGWADDAHAWERAWELEAEDDVQGQIPEEGLAIGQTLDGGCCMTELASSMRYDAAPGARLRRRAGGTAPREPAGAAAQPAAARVAQPGRAPPPPVAGAAAAEPCAPARAAPEPEQPPPAALAAPPAAPADAARPAASVASGAAPVYDCPGDGLAHSAPAAAAIPAGTEDGPPAPCHAADDTAPLTARLSSAPPFAASASAARREDVPALCDAAEAARGLLAAALADLRRGRRRARGAAGDGSAGDTLLLEGFARARQRDRGAAAAGGAPAASPGPPPEGCAGPPQLGRSAGGATPPAPCMPTGPAVPAPGMELAGAMAAGESPFGRLALTAAPPADASDELGEGGQRMRAAAALHCVRRSACSQAHMGAVPCAEEAAGRRAGTPHEQAPSEPAGLHRTQSGRLHLDAATLSVFRQTATALSASHDVLATPDLQRNPQSEAAQALEGIAHRSRSAPPQALRELGAGFMPRRVRLGGPRPERWAADAADGPAAGPAAADEAPHASAPAPAEGRAAPGGLQAFRACAEDARHATHAPGTLEGPEQPGSSQQERMHTEAVRDLVSIGESAGLLEPPGGLRPEPPRAEAARDAGPAPAADAPEPPGSPRPGPQRPGGARGADPAILKEAPEPPGSPQQERRRVDAARAALAHAQQRELRAVRLHMGLGAAARAAGPDALPDPGPAPGAPLRELGAAQHSFGDGTEQREGDPSTLPVRCPERGGLLREPGAVRRRMGLCADEGAPTDHVKLLTPRPDSPLPGPADGAPHRGGHAASAASACSDSQAAGQPPAAPGARGAAGGAAPDQAPGRAAGACEQRGDAGAMATRASILAASKAALQVLGWVQASLQTRALSAAPQLLALAGWSVSVGAAAARGK